MMAKGSIMLGIEVVQTVSPGVLTIPEIWTVALEPLDGDKTTVREIQAEKVQILSGSKLAEFETSSEGSLTDVFLVLPDDRQPLKVLHGPSHVSSPQFDGARMVILLLRDMGFSVPSPGKLTITRGIHAHTYVDEIV
jgi:hypothetical protein